MVKKKNTVKNETLTFRITDDDKKHFQKIADKYGITKSLVINEIIREYKNNKELRDTVINKIGIRYCD